MMGTRGRGPARPVGILRLGPPMRGPWTGERAARSVLAGASLG